MKIFVYAMREFDELPVFEAACREQGIDFGWTAEYPTLENAHLAEGCEGITIITNPLPPALLDRYHALGVRYIATRTIGFEHIDVNYARRLGMRVCNITYPPDGVADYTLMLMLMACRKLPYVMARANLQDYSLQGKLGKQLRGSTVGVIGTGRVGEAVIRRLPGFGCKVLAYDLRENPEVLGMAEYRDLNSLLEESDIVTLHAAALQSNRHMLGAAEFGRMKEGAILVNTARGSLVDTEALVEALKSGKLAYAALDTIEHEEGLYYHDLQHECLTRPQMALLRTLPNVLFTPHMAFYTEEAVESMVRNALTGLLQFHRGEANPFELMGN